MPDPELIAISTRVVAKTLGRLPEDLRVLAEGVPVHYEDYPDEELVGQGYDPDLLGLFIGASYGEEGHQDNPLPPQIVLYLESIRDYVEGDERNFCRELRTTYLHELGHYFGWDEDEVAARGLE